MVSKKQLADCKIEELKEKLRVFKTFSIESMNGLQETSKSLLASYSGADALADIIKQREEKRKQITSQNVIIQQARQELGKHEQKYAIAEGELNGIQTLIKGNCELEKLLRSEMKTLGETYNLLKQKEAEAPQTRTETLSGWKMFQRSTITKVDTLSNLKKSQKETEAVKAAKEEKIRKILKDINNFKKDIGQVEANLKIIDADRKNARNKLIQEEKGLQELNEQRDVIYKDLQNRFDKYGQGMTQLVETFQAAENFTGVFEKQLKHEIFAESMLIMVEQFQKNLEKIDKASTNSDKLRGITKLQNMKTTKFIHYLQTEFNGRLHRLIDVGAKAHDVAYIKEEQRKMLELKEPSFLKGTDQAGELIEY